MKTKFILILIVFFSSFSVAHAQLDLSKKIKDINYENNYKFDAEIEMEMDFFKKNGNHQMTIPYKSYYTNNYNYICIKILRGSTVYQTLFDFPNNNCLIILGEGNQIMGSAAVMKDNEGRELKELQLNKTDKTKDILGYNCTLYTYNTSKINGEIWATTAIDLPNDVGVLKASKMGKFYEKVPVDGFVMEIISITTKGKKTVMRTTAMHKEKTYEVNIPEDFGVAVNKIDYYDY